MKASKLNFDGQRFNPEEWPEGALSQMDARVVSALFTIRNNLPVTHTLWPSPVYAAHVRNDDTGSRHSIEHGKRLSDATDFFCKREHAAMVFFEILKQPRVFGIGVYRNALFRGSTEDYTMFHIDTRSGYEKAMWVADRESPKEPFQYTSINRDPQKFFEVLAKNGIWV